MKTQNVALNSGTSTPAAAKPTEQEVGKLIAAPQAKPVSSASDRVMRVDQRGRRILDAHTLPPRYAWMNAQLNANVLGQSHAFPPILKCIQRYESGLADPQRPVGAGFLGGPTGTGKTLTAEQISILLHKKPLYIEIDCGELQDHSAISSFVGSPPNWTGHGKTIPKLTQEFLDAHKSEHSDIVVLLLDEYEKAHADFQKLLLNVEEKGKLTIWVPKAGAGEKDNNNGAEEQQVKMYNVLILKTTNAGVERFSKVNNDAPSIGFGATLGGVKPKVLQRPIPSGDEFRDELRGSFSPEFLNRQDFFVFYNWLQPEFMPQIRRREIMKVEQLLNAKDGLEGVSLRVTPAAAKWVEERGFDQEYGARPLRRLIQNEIVSPIGNLMSDGIIKPFDAIAAHPSEDGERLDFVPLRLTTPRAKQKLSDAVAEDLTSKTDEYARADSMASVVDAIMSAVPEGGTLYQALQAAKIRAQDGKSASERTNILRDAIETVVRGHRSLRKPKEQAPSSPDAPATSSAKPESTSRALTVMTNMRIPALPAPTSVEVVYKNAEMKIAREAAGDDEVFGAQWAETMAILTPHLHPQVSANLLQDMVPIFKMRLANARVALAEKLEDIAFDLRPDWGNEGRTYTSTAAALRAAINLCADAEIMSAPDSTETTNKAREAKMQALDHASAVSGAQPGGSVENEARSMMPFIIFKRLTEDPSFKDGTVARLEAMRDIVEDYYNKGKPISADAPLGKDAAIVQAVGIAYATAKIENPTLLQTAAPVINRYLKERPLKATSSQLNALEQLIRQATDAPQARVEELCRAFKSAEAMSGSIFRGGAAEARKVRATLGLPSKPPRKPSKV